MEICFVRPTEVELCFSSQTEAEKTDTNFPMEN